MLMRATLVWKIGAVSNYVCFKGGSSYHKKDKDLYIYTVYLYIHGHILDDEKTDITAPILLVDFTSAEVEEEDPKAKCLCCTKMV